MKRYDNLKFDNLKGDYIKEAIKEMKELVKNPFEYKGNIFLSGDVGTGKTALMEIALQEIDNSNYDNIDFGIDKEWLEKEQEKKHCSYGFNPDNLKKTIVRESHTRISYYLTLGIRAVYDEPDFYEKDIIKEKSTEVKNFKIGYTTAKGIIDSIKASWSDKSEESLIHYCKSSDLLFIDEIGLQYGTDMERIELFEIIDYRYNNMLPTIFTSNFYKSELNKKLGQRISDRLLADCKYFEFKEKSKR